MAGIFSDIKEKVVKYIEVNISLFKINLIGKTSGLMSYFMFALIALFMVSCIILFVGFGLTEVFFESGFSRTASYFLTTGVYCLLLVVIVLLRRPIIRFFANSVVDVLTEDERNDEDSMSNVQ
jgi:hypothetical protein